MWKATSFLCYLCYQTLRAQPAPQVRSDYSYSRKQFKESKITKGKHKKEIYSMLPTLRRGTLCPSSLSLGS